MKALYGLGYACLVAAIGSVMAFNFDARSAATKPTDPGKTIGLVLAIETPGHWETPGAKDECPDGLQFTEKDNWDALKKEVRDERSAKFGHRWNRGPNGENSTTLPWAVDDPLPFREVQSKIAYGFNLDGTPDGRETAKTCKHEKFKGPDGEAGIDNQLYRVMGCAKGWRTGGAAATYRIMEFPTYSANRILFEVSNVDSEVNDDDVEVNVYKGLDTLLKDSRGEYLPNLTQRIDARYPVIARTRGKIQDGVLTIDPVDFARFPVRWNVVTGTRNWYDFNFKLKLTETGAEGIMGGYQDLENYWLMYRRGLTISVDNSAWSPPSMYAASVRLADGRRDPATGQCTAISSVLKVTAVRTFIVHPEEGENPGQFDLRGY